MKRYRKRPIEVEAHVWDGTEATHRLLVDWTKGGWRGSRTAGFTGEVYDYLHDEWIKVRTGDWIVKGIKGEFYPCEIDVFTETYEAI